MMVKFRGKNNAGLKERTKKKNIKRVDFQKTSSREVAKSSFKFKRIFSYQKWVEKLDFRILWEQWTNC